MVKALQGLHALSLAVAAIALLALVHIVWFRPKWARLEYDARLWKCAFADARSWIYDKTRTEVFVLVGSFIYGMFQSHAQAGLARIGDGLLASVGAIAIGLPVLFLWSYVSASWKVYQDALTAPYNSDVAFYPIFDGEFLFLLVRNHLKTGLFSAQHWLTEGIGIQNWTGQKSIPWRDTSHARREIVTGEEHCLKLLKIVASKEADHPRLQAFAYEAGDKETERSLPSGGGNTYGNDMFIPAPLKLHISVTDSVGVVRPLVLFVGMRTDGINNTIETHLIREY